MIRSSTAVRLAALLALFGAAPVVAAQTSADVYEIGFDKRRAADVLRRADGRIALNHLLRRAVSVRARSTDRTALVVHVYQMRGGTIVRRYASRKFLAPATGSVELRQVLRADEPRFGTFAFNAEHLVEAGEAVPADAAVEEPRRFLIDGIVPFHPKGWETRPAFYVVAVPAEARRAARASVRIGVLFAAGR